MKKGLILSLLFVGTSLLFVSCKKKCDIPESDTISGKIIDCVIYPSTGGMIPNGGLHVYAGQGMENNFEVSYDKGVTIQSIDYSQYNILGYPLVVNCDVALERNVEIDDLNQIVTFTVTVHDCKSGCDEARNVENYVLVPAFPTSYTIVYNVIE